MALEAKVDPAIDTTKPMYINGNSEEQRGEREQWQIKRDIWECTVRGVRYLKVVYHHQDDGVSVDAEVRPILTGAGIDAATIDLLVGKTQAKDN